MQSSTGDEYLSLIDALREAVDMLRRDMAIVAEQVGHASRMPGMTHTYAMTRGFSDLLVRYGVKLTDGLAEQQVGGVVKWNTGDWSAES